MATSESRENRLRRTAARRGLTLMKCRRRDPLAIGYGTYQLVDSNNHIYACKDNENGYGLTLDEIESALNAPKA